MAIGTPSRRVRSRRSSAMRPLDQLEARTLFSITTFPGATGYVSSLALDNSGHVYVIDAANNAILKFTRNSNNTLSTPETLSTGDSPAADLVFDTVNNKLYFTSNFGQIGVLNADGSGLQIVEIDDPVTNSISTPTTLSVAGDGSVWYAGFDTDYDTMDNYSVIGRLVNGDINNIQQGMVPTTQNYVTRIVTQADGSAWILNQGVNSGDYYNETLAASSISHVTVDSGGNFSFASTTVLPVSQAMTLSMASAQDGSLWITAATAIHMDGTLSSTPDQLLHATVDSGGTVSFSSVLIPHESGEHATQPSALSIDAAGTLWFVEQDWDADMAPIGGRLSSYNPTTDVFDRQIIPDTILAGALRTSIVTTSGVSTDVWFVTQDGVVVDAAIPQATATFSVSGSNVAGTEDVALAANVAGVSTPVVGTFDGPAGSYTVSIAWSDGSTSAGRIATGTDGNQYIALAVGASKTFATQGAYTGLITVSDGVTTHTGTAIVNVAAALNATQGVQVKPLFAKLVLANVTTFTSAINAPASAFKATINWGDGNTSTGVIVRNPLNPMQYFVIGAHNYHSSGSYTITTTIVNSSLSETTTGTAYVHV